MISKAIEAMVKVEKLMSSKLPAKYRYRKQYYLDQGSERVQW